jgi:hypothetical protein
MTPPLSSGGWAKSSGTGEGPTLKKAGRPKRVLSSWEEDKILELFASYPSNAVAVEKMLKRQGINISHDLIHRTLKERGFAASESNKRDRRKWVKNERRLTDSPALAHGLPHDGGSQVEGHVVHNIH